MMDENDKKLKVYCETSFWSYLVGGRTDDAKVISAQAITHKWWVEVAPRCEVYVSPFVTRECARGNPVRSQMRMSCIHGLPVLDGFIREVRDLSNSLRQFHAVPEDEAVDASHIAIAAVYGMDILLTWNCRHMANPMTLPKTVAIVTSAGYQCPAIVTPAEFMERIKEVFP